MCPSYQIVGDNVDLHQKPTNRSIERRARDHHWFHLYAVRDRISGLDQSNDAPIANIATVPLQTFLPSLAECLQLREEFAVLVSWVLVARMAYLEPLKSVVSEHIRHKHYSEVKAKSEIVSVYIVQCFSLVCTLAMYMYMYMQATSDYFSIWSPLLIVTYT